MDLEPIFNKTSDYLKQQSLLFLIRFIAAIVLLVE